MRSRARKNANWCAAKLAYREGRDGIPLEGRVVILIDDGLATGSTMMAAVKAVRQRAPARVIVAVPVGARDTCEALSAVADEVVCVRMPEPFSAVGQWYLDFDQTSDEEVRKLLRAHTRIPARPIHRLAGTSVALIRAEDSANVIDSERDSVERDRHDRLRRHDQPDRAAHCTIFGAANLGSLGTGRGRLERPRGHSRRPGTRRAAADALSSETATVEQRFEATTVVD